MINFDEIEEWAPQLEELLVPYLPPDYETLLVNANPIYLENARDFVVKIAGQERIIQPILDWVSSETIMGFHGSRLIESEVASIATDGLKPLIGAERKHRLVRALSGHPQWEDVLDGLEGIIAAYSGLGIAGSREGQVNLTLSRSGLLNGFDHYWTHGSEFDQHIAFKLFGEEGMNLLRADGSPYIFHVGIPGELALQAAHPIYNPIDMLQRGEIPNIVNQLLQVWSFKAAHPDFDLQKQEFDCGIVFHEVVDASWIVDIEPIH